MQNQLSLISQEKPTFAKLALINMPKGSTMEDAEKLVMKELANLDLVISQKPEILNCTPNSMIQAVKQVINDNLTLSPSAGLVYLYPERVSVGLDDKGQKIYDTVLMYKPTANGLLSIARQAGRILDNKRPNIEYDTDGSVKSVTVEFLVPSVPSPRWEVITFYKPHFEKWKSKSASKFGGKPNANYTSWVGGIDPDFASSKAIRHGLDKLGTNMNERRRIAGMATEFTPVETKAALKEVSDEVFPVQLPQIDNNEIDASQM